MSFVTLDFETYYAKDFSLSKMTTEEYIRDPRFQIIGVGVKENDGEPVWFSGSHDEIKEFLNRFDWSSTAVLCHNAMFDGAILEWVLDIHPNFYYDTLCMARALHGVDAGGSLAALVQRYEIGEKGTEVHNNIGKRREDFSPAELELYGHYCTNDVELTCKLFAHMAPVFPEVEFNLVDMTLKMFTRPTLMVDDALLVTRLDEIKAEKTELLNGLRGLLDCGLEEEVRKKLCSNKQFAQILEDFNIPVPMKISPTTGNLTFALAKNDVGFMALQEHPDPIIQQLCAVRLGTKSTIEESRIERFIGIGARNNGMLPIPLKYYGAHTGRWSGQDSVNFQNLPSRDAKKKALKNSVLAPRGHVVINCDSSQIEARVLAWLAEQEDMVEAFRNKRDIYSEFATHVYNRTITKKDPVERFVGKTCILGLGYGTGAAKLQHTLGTAHPVSVRLEEHECKRIVHLYRQANSMIPRFWNDCDRALSWLMSTGANVGKSYYLDNKQVVEITPEGIRLPNRLYIRYPNLRTSGLENGCVYTSRRGVIKIWGGAVTENIVQALARIIVGEQMLKVNERYRTVLTVHDAGVWVVPESEVDDALAFIVKTMSTPPDWCADLPVACEAKYGQSYGDC